MATVKAEVRRGNLDAAVKILMRNALAITYLTNQARDYRADVGQRILAEGLKWRTTAPVDITLKLYFRDKRKSDISNRIKSLEDALEAAGVFQNDYQVDDLHVHRCGVDRDNPRVEVTIKELETVLI